MFSWLFNMFDLPKDVFNKSPRIELIDNLLQINNYISLGNFDEEELRINLYKGKVVIKGSNLRIKYIYKDAIFVEGTFAALYFEKGD